MIISFSPVALCGSLPYSRGGDPDQVYDWHAAERKFDIPQISKERDCWNVSSISSRLRFLERKPWAVWMYHCLSPHDEYRLPRQVFRVRAYETVRVRQHGEAGRLPC